MPEWLIGVLGGLVGGAFSAGAVWGVMTARVKRLELDVYDLRKAAEKHDEKDIARFATREQFENLCERVDDVKSVIEKLADKFDDVMKVR